MTLRRLGWVLLLGFVLLDVSVRLGAQAQDRMSMLTGDLYQTIQEMRQDIRAFSGEHMAIRERQAATNEVLSAQAGEIREIKAQLAEIGRADNTFLNGHSELDKKFDLLQVKVDNRLSTLESTFDAVKNWLKITCGAIITSCIGVLVNKLFPRLFLPPKRRRSLSED